MKDEQLMLLVKKGKLDALSDLFERYNVRLYNFFLKLTHDSSLSQDLTQTVFERIIKYRGSFRNDSNFKAWIYQIARNVKTDHYRKNKVKLDDSVNVSDLNLVTDSLHVELEKVERRKAVQVAIKNLKPEYREVLLLGWFEKMSYAEVGEILGLTIPNVKIRMHRAVKQLKKHFNTMTCL